MGKKSTKIRSDPLVGQAARANAEIGSRAQELAEQNWQWNKELTEKYAPLYEQLISSQIAQSDLNAGQSEDQWKQYRRIFQPIENIMAQEALDYDSAQEVDRRAGLAAATTAKQFDGARDAHAREMGRMGISPTSSVGAQAYTDQFNQEALAKAGSINQERNNTKLLGMSLRQDAARFGRNQTGTGLAASAAALQGSHAAAGTMGGQTAQGNAAGTAQGLMGTAISGHSAAGNLALNQWQTKVQAEQSAQAGLGSLVGTLGSAAILASSEKLKEDKQPVNDQEALEGLKRVPVENWKYKAGVADEGQHTGPYAEDMNREFGDEVAPGGMGLDMVSVSGKHHAAIRALGRQVDRINDALGLSEEPTSTPKRGRQKVATSKVMDMDLSPGLIGLVNA
ncbi:tail fiber domain-containing protein [Allopusillimonas ginsengisoli]|uniref:tail fiber domain-containing protein n=1 Tax=Allopusillimonas ginsengisoli TaxID=453575 RepID=UPI0039C38EB4